MGRRNAEATDWDSEKEYATIGLSHAALSLCRAVRIQEHESE